MATKYVNEMKEELIGICHNFVVQIYSFKNHLDENENVHAQAVKNNVMAFMEKLKVGIVEEL